MSTERLRAVPSELRPSGESGLIERYITGVTGLLRGIRPEAVAALVRALEAARDAGRTVFTFGNGGSAATALHVANDLARAAGPDGRPLKVVCLTANVSLLSALANDHGYEEVFVRQLQGMLRPGDVALGISASGSSPNCVRALAWAREHGAVTLGLLGFDGGAMRALCDACVLVPSSDYLPVEDVHLILCHLLTRALREGL